MEAPLTELKFNIYFQIGYQCSREFSDTTGTMIMS